MNLLIKPLFFKMAALTIFPLHYQPIEVVPLKKQPLLEKQEQARDEQPQLYH